MKKNLLLFVSFILFLNNIYAQAPSWQWASSAGGDSALVYSQSISVDRNGNCYATGYYHADSLWFDTIGLRDPGINNYFDLFITKYNSIGEVQWAKGVGGDSHEAGNGISNDSLGNVYVTGYFQSNTITFGNDTLINPISAFSPQCFFLVKYDPAGSVIWARGLVSKGTGGNVSGNDISIDALGNIFVTGDFSSDTVRFDTTSAGMLVNTHPGQSNDLFIVKYDSSGNLLWAKKAGPINNGSSRGICIDSHGNCCIVGGWDGFSPPSFDTTSLNGGPGFNNFNIFLAKYDSSGNVIWAKGITGDQVEYGYDIACDGNDNIFIAGEFNSSTLPFQNDTLILKGANDAFVAKFNSTGNELWALEIGQTLTQSAKGINADINGNICVVGIFSGSIIVGNDTLISNSQGDGFILKFDTGGNPLWSESVGGNGNDYVTSVVSDMAGNNFVSGIFRSSSIDIGGNILNHIGTIGQDIFIAKQDGFVGIKNLEINNQLLIYPNPTLGVINISLSKPVSNAKVSIYDPLGKIVHSETFSGKDGAINCKLHAGVYFIQVTDTSSRWVGRIISN